MKSCQCCSQIKPLMFSGDPTRTTTLRMRWVNDFKRRFKSLKQLSDQSLVANDALDLKDSEHNSLWFSQVSIANKIQKISAQHGATASPMGYKQYAGKPDKDKMIGYMSWLENTIYALLYTTVINSTISNDLVPLTIWISSYIAEAYQHGMLWARHSIRKDPVLLKQLGLSKDDIRTDRASILSSFNLPINQTRASLIYLRDLSDLEGITQAMSTSISRALSDGLIRGDNPSVIAREISSKIESIGAYRATLLARTEVIRAHHLASIQTYRSYGIEGVTVKAEWVTAGDSRVCSICAALEGQIFKLDEVEDMIPVHPQCRCAVVPVAIPDAQ